MSNDYKDPFDEVKSAGPGERFLPGNHIWWPHVRFAGMRRKLSGITEKEAKLYSLAEVGAAEAQGKLLYYHNYDHPGDLLEAHRLLWDEPDYNMLLAIGWHDAVYVPYAPSGWNEELSYLALTHYIRQTVGGLAFAKTYEGTCALFAVEALIKSTTVENHLSPAVNPTETIRRIQDCDLQAFGRSYEEFQESQAKVVKELVGELELDQGGALFESRVARKQAEFLAQFIAPERKTIYRTKEAQERWEDQARANIKFFCEIFLT